MIFGNFIGSPFIFEIWIGNAMLENTQMTAPMPIVYTQFMGIVDRLAKDKQPMKVVCRGICPVEKFNGETEDKPAKVIFYNATYESEIGIDE